MTKHNEPRDPNRSAVSRATGEHPVGLAVGGVAGGATAGAIAGTMFGPIGTLIGAGIGVVAGAAIGRGVAARVDAKGETDYWRHAYQERPYAKHEYDFDRDYSAAYGYGLQAREQYGPRAFEESENQLRDGWEKARGQSRLSWEEARPAVRDAFDRAERTYKTYEESDGYFESRFGESTYVGRDESFEDYRPAYRYGVLARTRYGLREWDDELDQELSRGWSQNLGDSRLDWDRARPAVREAYNSPHISDYSATGGGYTRDTGKNESMFRVR